MSIHEHSHAPMRGSYIRYPMGVRTRSYWQTTRAYIAWLMRSEGLVEANAEPRDEDIRRFDKSHGDKKVSNQDWQSSTDPDVEIAKM